MARNKIHIILITICTLLLLGDFMTTSMALSLTDSSEAGMRMSIAEGNPFMAQIVNVPALFLLVKVLILLVVIAATYILRKEGAMAYLPSALVCSFYMLINMNNINILVATLS